MFSDGNGVWTCCSGREYIMKNQPYVAAMATMMEERSGEQRDGGGLGMSVEREEDECTSGKLKSFIFR